MSHYADSIVRYPVTLWGTEANVPPLAQEWTREGVDWKMYRFIETALFWSETEDSWTACLSVNLTFASLLTSAEELAWITNWRRTLRCLQSDGCR